MGGCKKKQLAHECCNANNFLFYKHWQKENAMGALPIFFSREKVNKCPMVQHIANKKKIVFFPLILLEILGA